jgi:inner membrane transporter RhtA
MRTDGLALLLPVLGMVMGMVSITVGTSYAKQLFPVVGAQGTTACRVGFSALVLMALWRPWRRRLSRREAGAIVLYGAVLGLMNLCFYMAIRTIPLGLAVAIEFTGPLLVAVLSSRRAADFVWVGLAVAGLLLLVPIRQGATALDPVGIGYVLAAATFWALYIVLGQKAGRGHGGQAVSLGLTVAALVVLPFGIAHAGAALLSPAVLLFGLGIGILSSAVPYSLEMIALRALPRQTFGIILCLEPAVAALAGLAILGEHLTAIEWLAIASIIVASGGSTWSLYRSRSRLAPI